ncbi:MAG TPA: hypothetical protein VE987_12950 [Polyangiaceae bacterium]|nr:hypothetical protein [Polyangiaceae bacterium]
MRKAAVCGTSEDEDGTCYVHITLDADDQVVAVRVPLHIMQNIDAIVGVDVPPGDVTTSEVQAGIRWRF